MSATSPSAGDLPGQPEPQGTHTAARASFPLLPAGFRFGTSTAAYQIEGAPTADGKGRSIWDTFTHQPGTVIDGSTGDVACDHYHRLDEDLDLLGRLGAPGYRFSLSWTRIQPNGKGAANPKGLDFYDRLIDGLLERGIAPMVTLHHWDLPQALEDDGGWLNRDTASRFAEFARIAGERFADRVDQWVPINEPNIMMLYGYASGVHAPGKQLWFDALPAAHHLLLGHGYATRALREFGSFDKEVQVGCANNHAPIWPASDDPADVGASKLFDQLYNGAFLEPMLLGRYPVDVAMFLEPVIRDGDLAAIRQPLDFYGINYYNPQRIAANSDEFGDNPFELRDILGYPTTDFDWPIIPDAFRDLLISLRARYRAALPPIVITESGCSYGTGPDAAGVVDDQNRIQYLFTHISAVAEAVNRGVDVRGYYTWTTMDNFEWAEGFTQRFGLVWVDFETQQRIPKRSFEWYSAMIKRQPRSDA